MNAPASQVVRQSAALMSLGEWLKAQSYRFAALRTTTSTRMKARRADQAARDVRDVFGWGLPFAPGTFDARAIEWLDEADLLEQRDDGLLQSGLRCTTVLGELFLHSPVDTVHPESVRFGPDVQRFCRTICCELADAPLASPSRMLHAGCGAGAGGIVAARDQRHADVDLVLADANPRALQFASANAAIAGVDAELAQGAPFDAVDGEFDLVVANLAAFTAHDAAADVDIDARRREAHRFVEDGMSRLAPGGRLVLCAEVPIADGRDALLESVETLLQRRTRRWRYQEIEPDLCTDALDAPALAQAERIAAIAIVAERGAR